MRKANEYSQVLHATSKVRGGGKSIYHMAAVCMWVSFFPLFVRLKK